MRKLGSTLLLLTALALLYPLHAQFKSGTRMVPLYVTVTDAGKRLVADLAKDDFELFEDDRPRAIDLFENEHIPIAVAVMLDTSGSMTLVLDRVKAGAEQFLIRLHPDDQGAVGAFSDKIYVSGLTDDRDSLVAELKELDFGYPTRLYDALSEAMLQLRQADRRKVVLVFTDGEDTASRTGRDAVVDRARNENVMVYGIGMRTVVGPVRSRPDRVLKKLADETGGGYYELKQQDPLTSTFTEIATELHSQYVLGFVPERLDGRVHKLEVRVKRPGLTARSRKSYLAAPEGSGTRSLRLDQDDRDHRGDEQNSHDGFGGAREIQFPHGVFPPTED
ncbi:MAG: VWA domain-containing protein [Acidobacteria bacterium]|nr:VWA domain-containing protein [Acidobacteriota bacterium]